MARYGVEECANAKADAALRAATLLEQLVEALAAQWEADGRYYTAVERSRARARQMAPVSARRAG
jgi:hypothetical protein